MISSRDNPTVKLAAKLMNSSSARREEGFFCAEGVRLCRDAAESGADIQQYLYTEQAAKKYPKDHALLLSVSKNSSAVSQSVLEKICDTKSPQGLFCIISISQPEMTVKPGCRYVAAEDIRDPSNLGTILRTAEALGIDGVILSDGCCDIYSPKVVRGTMGAVFRLPFMIVPDLSDLVRELSERGIQSFASTPRNADDIRNTDLSNGGVMLIGNEGNGLQDKTINACTHRVMIPMKGRAESLNASAAAAILMYEFCLTKE